jgi:hypothetical protein
LILLSDSDMLKALGLSGAFLFLQILDFGPTQRSVPTQKDQQIYGGFWLRNLMKNFDCEMFFVILNLCIRYLTG